MSLMEPEGTSEIRTPARVSQVSGWAFTTVVYEKIYLEVYINNEYICLKKDFLHVLPRQLYFILGRAGLRWEFSNLHVPRTALFHIYPQNLLISKPILMIVHSVWA